MKATNALLDELPAVGHEPATKADIAAVRAEIADVRVQIAEVRVEVARAADGLRKTMIWLIGSIFAVMMATVVGLVVPLVTLA